MRSTSWCSRNDVITNRSVLVAAAAVAWTGTQWIDVAVGLGIAALFFQSAVGVQRDAAAQMRQSANGMRASDRI
jgi:Co/Zn/Cd efflux system component